jgi:hypothetical protein
MAILEKVPNCGALHYVYVQKIIVWEETCIRKMQEKTTPHGRLLALPRENK